ncbi:MAG: hypothetical protein QF554_01655 [Dehalococcoidia bacterium]|jgi:hypothetical protein|nr:hypothetical protein [Dehalococcoidia bacterium]
MPELPITEVFAANQASLMELRGVVGVGIGELDGRACIRVMVENATPAVVSGIPDRLGGYPVIADEIGEIRALDAE